MIEIYYPDTLLRKQWKEATNAYAADRLAPNQRKDVSIQDILRFLATLAYMGVCKLPAKEDYIFLINDQTYCLNILQFI
jgi:hypothetical protein